MYDWSIQDNEGITIIASFNDPTNLDGIKKMLKKYRNILQDKHYTLHLYINDTEVKVCDISMEAL